MGQILNLSSLGSDAGVSHTTASHWMTVLEASYIVFRLPPYYANIRKRLVKSPKLYFHDVGLVSHLIGIENASQISTHPLRGPLFENAAVTEALKYRLNRGRRPKLFFFRDTKGLECDLLYQSGNSFCAIEIKAGSTVASDYFDALDMVSRQLPEISSKTVVYGGTERQFLRGGEVVTLSGLREALETFEQGNKAS